MGSDDDDDKSNASGSEEEDDDDDEDKSGSDDDEDEDGSGSDDDDSGSGSDDDDDSGSGSGDDDDDSDDKEDDSSDEDGKKGGKDKVIPNELQKPEENELKKLTIEIGSIQSEVDNFLCTLSIDTQNRIGFDPIQAQMNNISNRQIYPYQSAASPLNRNNYTENMPANNNFNNNNNNFRLSNNQANSPSRSPYNTYGQYRFQADSQPAMQELKNSGGFSKQGRKGSMEEVAEIQAMLGKQQQHNDEVKNSDQPKERFQLPKESQSIIDNYYQNLYRKKEPSSRNYSNVEDLYKQRQKTVYDEDEIRRKPINNDQKYFRDSGMQAAMPKLSQNQQKIDEAIRILLGKR